MTDIAAEALKRYLPWLYGRVERDQHLADSGRVSYANVTSMVPRSRSTEMNATTISAIDAALAHAREKFPSNRYLLAALVEEVGEVALAMMQGDQSAVKHEILQVAAVAVRIFEEGDATDYARSYHPGSTATTGSFIEFVYAAGEVGRALLQRKALWGVTQSVSYAAMRVSQHGDRTFDDITDAESLA